MTPRTLFASRGRAFRPACDHGGSAFDFAGQERPAATVVCLQARVKTRLYLFGVIATLSVVVWPGRTVISVM
jgi:hypothetical protein